MIKDLLKIARDRLRRKGRPEPTADRPELEALMKELLEDLHEAITADDKVPIRPGMWIFKARPDIEVYLQAAASLLERAEERGRIQASEAMQETADWSCGCRCRAHGRAGCPHCVAVEHCQVHSTLDPSDLVKSRDPTTVAEAFYRRFCYQMGLNGSHQQRTWTGPSNRYDAAMIEAMAWLLKERIL